MSPQAQLLVAVDFSASSDEVVRLATKLAHPAYGEVIVLHVDVAPETAPLSADARARRGRLRSGLEQIRERLTGCGISAVALLRPGDPGREILRVAQARAPQMIVVGAHGQSPATTPLLGGVADRVVRDSPYPVLVVPFASRLTSASTGVATPTTGTAARR